MQPCVWVKGPGCEQFGEARYRSWHLESVAELTVAEVRPRCGRGAAEVRPRCGRGAAEVRPRCGRGAAEGGTGPRGVRAHAAPGRAVGSGATTACGACLKGTRG